MEYEIRAHKRRCNKGLQLGGMRPTFAKLPLEAIDAATLDEQCARPWVKETQTFAALVRGD
jgi:hypothetical protein